MGGHVPLWGELVQPATEHGGSGLRERREAGVRGDGEVVQDLVWVEMGWQAERCAFSPWCLHGRVPLCVILNDAVDEPGPGLLILAPSLAAALAACPVRNGAVREHSCSLCRVLVNAVPSGDVSDCSWPHPELLRAPSDVGVCISMSRVGQGLCAHEPHGHQQPEARPVLHNDKAVASWKNGLSHLG